jgi:hypothetical protein
MKFKKIKGVLVSTLIVTSTLAGSCFAYSADFKGTWNNGDKIDGSENGRYYQLDAKNTKITATAKVTNTSLGATEKVYIEVRRKTTLGSAREHYYTSGTYKNSLTMSTSFKPSKSGKHYLILRKAQRNVPGTISGTISQ